MPIGATIATEEVFSSVRQPIPAYHHLWRQPAGLCGGAGDHQCVAGAETPGSG
ncbi:hypothetical protein ACLB1M_24595 [Escherichia coli]